jgi:hypothetical protein
MLETPPYREILRKSMPYSVQARIENAAVTALFIGVSR